MENLTARDLLFGRILNRNTELACIIVPRSNSNNNIYSYLNINKKDKIKISITLNSKYILVSKDVIGDPKCPNAIIYL